MSLIFGIDHGNGNIKTPHCEFPCGLIKQETKPAAAYGQDILKYKNMYYSLSDSRFPYKEDKTEDEDYFILTLFAIIKEAEAREEKLNGKDIILSVGLPPADFGLQSEGFEKYFLDRGRYGTTVEYNGKPCTFYIKKVYSAPQNFAAVIVMRPDLVKGFRTVYCIDIGDGTVDLLVLKNSRPDLSVQVSEKIGMAVLRAKIINEVWKDKNIRLDDDTAEQALKGERTVLPEDVKKIIVEKKEEWVKDMINRLHPYVPDFRINPTVFLGGGSILLKKQLQESPEFSLTEFIEDTKANAIGYQTIAELREQP